MVSRLLGGIEPMPVKNDTYFRHLKAGEKDYKRSDSGGLFMLVTKTGSKLWRYSYNFDSKQKLLALGQYPVTSLADARIKRDDAKRLLGEGIDPSVNRKEERRNARMARANTFEAVAKELMDKSEAEGDAPKTLKKKQWLLDFANKDSGSGRSRKSRRRKPSRRCGRSRSAGGTKQPLARVVRLVPYSVSPLQRV